MARKKVTHKFKTKKRDGKTLMICRNSIEDQSYWGWQILSKHPRCNEWSEVSPNSTAVLCYKCTCKTVGPPEVRGGYKSTGRMRGWQFMKEFVDMQGNVFHKGVEQPKLKGTLKPSVIKTKPPKKRLSKKEKERIRVDALAKIHKLKKDLGKAKFKKDIKKINSEIRKLNKLIK